MAKFVWLNATRSSSGAAKTETPKNPYCSQQSPAERSRMVVAQTVRAAPDDEQELIAWSLISKQARRRQTHCIDAGTPNAPLTIPGSHMCSIQCRRGDPYSTPTLVLRTELAPAR